jgi:hypothetical protein
MAKQIVKDEFEEIRKAQNEKDFGKDYKLQEEAWEYVKKNPSKAPAFDDSQPVQVKPPKKMAKGGSASKRADGCAIKGKTKGRMI